MVDREAGEEVAPVEENDAGGNGVAGVQERDAGVEVRGDGDGVLPVPGPGGERGHGVREGGREEACQAREEEGGPDPDPRRGVVVHRGGGALGLIAFFNFDLGVSM